MLTKFPKADALLTRIKKSRLGEEVTERYTNLAEVFAEQRVTIQEFVELFVDNTPDVNDNDELNNQLEVVRSLFYQGRQKAKVAVSIIKSLRYVPEEKTYFDGDELEDVVENEVTDEETDEDNVDESVLNTDLPVVMVEDTNEVLETSVDEQTDDVEVTLPPLDIESPTFPEFIRNNTVAELRDIAEEHDIDLNGETLKNNIARIVYDYFWPDNDIDEPIEATGGIK